MYLVYFLSVIIVMQKNIQKPRWLRSLTARYELPNLVNSTNSATQLKSLIWSRQSFKYNSDKFYPFFFVNCLLKGCK